MEILFLLLGFVVLVKGADLLVEGAVSIAKKAKISHVAIGLTVVAFGTSLPELVVTLMSSFSGHNEILIGTILGSNIANILLMLGICALIRPLLVKHTTLFQEIPFMTFIAVLLVFLVSDRWLWGSSENILSRVDGILLLALFLFFTFWTLKRGKKSFFEDEDQSLQTVPLSKAWVMVSLGLLGLVFGGRWIVNGAVYIAHMFGISESIIGLTIVGVGTSLPEIAASAVAVYRNRVGIAIGNAVGSNIFNIVMVLGTNAVINPIPYLVSFNRDLMLVIVVSLILFFFAWIEHRKVPEPFWRRLTKWEWGTEYSLRRWQGFAFLVLYSLYVWSLVMQEVSGQSLMTTMFA